MTLKSDLILLLTQHQNFIITTHKNSDGDGIGSAVALYWALKQINKNVTFCHVDPVPHRYHFMLKNTESFLYDSKLNLPFEVLIITDTNQGSLADPLYSHAVDQNKQIIYIDHHIPMSNIKKNEFYFIETQASSTGEVIYDILKDLKINITPDIATALYTSITFDTQAFKLLRNSSRSHEIAAVLAKNNIQTDLIQRELFATWTVKKMNFLAQLIQTTHYSNSNTVAGFTVTQDLLKKYDLELDHINDLLDMFTLIKTVEVCYGIIEITDQKHKLSFRSITTNKAHVLAENFGGGGHAKSAGAWVIGSNIQDIENKILHLIN